MADYQIKGETLTGIADQVRRLSGGAESLTPAQMQQNLEQVKAGEDLNIAWGDTAPEDTTKLWVKTGAFGKVHVNSNYYDYANNEELETDFATLATGVEAPNGIVAVGEKIYAIGGSLGNWMVTAEIQCFDTVTKETTVVGQLPQQSYTYAAAAVGTKIYIFGGFGWETADYLDTVQCFDTADHSLVTLDMTVTKRGWASCAAVGSKIYVFGGQSAEGEYQSVVECFDTSDNSVTILDTRLNCGIGASAVTAGGKIYIMPGWIGSYNTAVYVLDPETDTISTAPWTIYTGQKRGAAAVGDKIYVLGGYSGGRLATVICIDTAEATTKTLTSLPHGRDSVSAVAVGANVYVIGGYETSTDATDTIYRIRAEYPLKDGELLIVTDAQGSEFVLESTDRAEITVCAKQVYRGSGDNVAEIVEAFVYADDTWVSVS